MREVVGCAVLRVQLSQKKSVREVLDKKKNVCYICINWVTAQSVCPFYIMRAPYGEGRD